MSFAHLHTHSMYSLLEASIQPKKLAKQAAAMGIPAVALTDNGNMFGAIEFYDACKASGIKGIIGLDAYIAPKSRLVKGEDREAVQMPNRRIVLLAKSYEGYQSLCKISTIGYQEGFYYKPRIDYDVLKANSKDIIALSGGFMGDIPYHFRTHGAEKTLELIKMYKEIFPEHFYLEMCRTGLPEWNAINHFYLEASKILNVPVVATNDVHYMKQEDQMAQEVLICVGSNRTLQDESRFRLGSSEFYLKSPEQMKDLFADIPEAIENTVRIAEQCDVKFKLKDENGKRIYHLPSYPTTEGASLADEMRKLSLKGLEERFIEASKRGDHISEEKKPEYYSRLDYELSVIEKMGFNGYFLIVQDFISWAKNNGCPVGPGRGSGAGSLVAYSLGITDLDPLPYNLIFERFLNPERISMPDFDIDFCQENRERVIHYVVEKYGAHSVSQIITFGKLQSRAAIRDVGRVLGMSFQEVDVVAKLIPDKLGINLEDSIKEEARLRELMDTDPKINTLMELAQKVEGLTRHASIHAAGVIISNRPLIEYAPLYRGADNENVLQYDMKNAENIGLIKFDFLGLKTLTLIADALDLIKQNRGKVFSPSDISLKDPGVYEIMSDGDTAGIFQFEGDGITEFTKKVKPNCFEDITAINALYRPGPMQFLDEYNGRKHGRIKVSYLFPELESILKETYGIIVYQEHVQLIAARIASYSLGEADILRRAMGKKDPKEMALQRDRFMKGAADNNYDKEKAAELFDQMAKFAEYGFNKSHAAAYCVLAAQTAWLKRYFPVEFFAATLSTELSNTDKVVQYIKDARRHDIEVRAPHINYSARKFSVKGDVIYFGLGAIKGVGDSAIDAIFEARELMPNKTFESIDDFFNNVDLRRVNKKVVECLIKGGALDGFNANRAQLMSSYAQIIDLSESARRDKEMGQSSLFDLVDSVEDKKFIFSPMEEWNKSLRLAYEKEVLGFYLSEHPLQGLDKVLSVFCNAHIGDIPNRQPKERLSMAGLIVSSRELITKKGTRMAFAYLEDLHGQIELVLFPDTFAKYGNTIKTDSPLVVHGSFENDDRGMKIIVDTIETLESKFEQTRLLQIELEDENEDKLQALRSLMFEHSLDEKNQNRSNLNIRSKTKVQIVLGLKEQKKQVILDIPEPKVLSLDQSFFERYEKIFGTMKSVRLM